jgi:hypothetical protein
LCHLEVLWNLSLGFCCTSCLLDWSYLDTSYEQ